MRRLLEEEGVAVSRLAEVEIVSGLVRLTREDALTTTTRDAAITSFLQDLDGWDVVEITREVTARAREALLLHRLRASDAIQLASGLVLQSRIGQPLEMFVTLDTRLAGAAKAERFNVTEG
jgi:predicted nucleic acid-binding protein